MIINDAKRGQSRISLHSAQSLGAGITRHGSVDVILDRRLMQDDSRGLGQGLMDNKLTPNDFWLVIENFSDQNLVDKDASDYTIYPTVRSQHVNSMLNNPILTLLPSPAASSRDQGRTESSQMSPYLLSFNAFDESALLPCDVHLINLRTLQLQPKFEALAIFHRQGLSNKLIPNDDMAAPLSCNSSNKISLRSIFKPICDSGNELGLKFTEVYLNGATEKDTSSSAGVDSEVMDKFQISAYRVEIAP